MNASIIARLLALGAIWGVSFALQRVAVPSMGTTLVAFGRLVLAAVALLLLIKALGRPLNWRQRWRDYLLVGALSSAVPFWMFAYAAGHLPAGYSAILNATTPMFTVLLAWHAGTRPSLSKFVGVIVGVVGVGLIAGFGAVQLNLESSLAFGAGLIAALMYAFAAFATRKRFAGTDPFVVAAGSVSASTILLSPLALRDLGTLAHVSGEAWLAITILGLVCTGAAYMLYFGLLRDAGAERATTVTLLVPMFALGWAFVLLHEPIAWRDVAGCALVLFAVSLVFEKWRWPARHRAVALTAISKQ